MDGRLINDSELNFINFYHLKIAKYTVFNSLNKNNLKLLLRVIIRNQNMTLMSVKTSIVCATECLVCVRFLSKSFSVECSGSTGDESVVFLQDDQHGSGAQKKSTGMGEDQQRQVFQRDHQTLQQPTPSDAERTSSRQRMLEWLQATVAGPGRNDFWSTWPIPNPFIASLCGWCPICTRNQADFKTVWRQIGVQTVQTSWTRRRGALASDIWGGRSRRRRRLSLSVSEQLFDHRTTTRHSVTRSDARLTPIRQFFPWIV